MQAPFLNETLALLTVGFFGPIQVTSLSLFSSAPGQASPHSAYDMLARVRDAAISADISFMTFPQINYYRSNYRHEKLIYKDKYLRLKVIAISIA